MKRITLLLALLAVGWSPALAAPASTNSAAANRVLLIDRSSMRVDAGKATLTIDPLKRTNGVYTGDYKLTVFPWSLNNEKGTLAILVSDESLAEANQGKVVTITGTATASGKGGTCRPIVAIATPVDKDHGTLKLWFMAGSRKMIFTPAYHFGLHAQSDSTDKSPHKTGFITVNKVKLHYLDWGGKGETLLFLHGMSGTAHFYDDFAPRFTNQFRVLGLTRRGHGESEMPETGYDTATLVEDVRQFLDALKIQRVVLAGHSFAGDEVTRLAVMFPDRVSKLIYFDSAYDHSRIPENLRWKSPHGVVPEFLPTKEESESPDGGRRWVMRIWGEKTGRMIYSMIEGTYAETHEYGKIKAPALAFFATGYCPSSPADSKCRGFDRKKIVEWVESLHEPQRKDAQEFIQAQQKYYEQEIEHFRREIPNGRTIVFTNADHVCFIDREPDVLREMRRFLRK